jgi:hypothetical protein
VGSYSLEGDTGREIGTYLPVDAQEGSWIRRSREMRWKGKEGLQQFSMMSAGERNKGVRPSPTSCRQI